MKSAAVFVYAAITLLTSGSFVLGQPRTPSQELTVGVDNASPVAAALPAQAQFLLTVKPGLRAVVSGNRPAAFYGASIVAGATPDEAEARFWTEYSPAFGIDGLSVGLSRTTAVVGGRSVVFAYQQRIDGLPVEYTVGRLIVSNGDFADVTYVSGKFVPREPLFAPISLTPAAAIATVAETAPYDRLTEWSGAELVVFAGTEDQWEGLSAIEPVRSWKFRGESVPADGLAAFTFFVDAASGALVHVRDEVLSADVIGTVIAEASPGMLPDVSYNLPQDIPVPDILVEVVGGNSAYSDANGNFVIPHAGSSPVTVTASVMDGRWVSVHTGTGTELLASSIFTPGVASTLRLNDTPGQYGTAQANAFVHVNRVHAFFKSELPGWTGLDYPFIAWSSHPDATCNAFYSGHQLLLAPASADPCANAAYSSVVAHETGHWVVNQLGLGQLGFGEGFSDALAMLIYDDPQIAEDFYGPGVPIRNYAPGQPEQTYPCTDTITHLCGRILGGLWWDIRENTGNLAETRRLFANWSQITCGGTGYNNLNSAHPLTLVEILTVDDTPGLFPGGDGNLANGTPHCAAICAAAAAHGIPCDTPPYCDAPPPAPPGTNPILSFNSSQIWKSSENGATGVDPFGIAVSDLNGDGIRDVILACEGSNNVLVYLGLTPPGNTTSVAFAPPVAYAVGTGTSRPMKVVLADMAIPGYAPDGVPDIVVSLYAQNAIQILRNQGNGTFLPSNPAEVHTISLSASPTVLGPVELAVVDWDNNGRNDIAVAGYQTGGQHGRPTLGLAFAHNSNGTFARQAIVGRSNPPASQLLNGHGWGLKAWTDIESSPPAGFFSPTGLTNLARLTMTVYDEDYAEGDLFIFKHMGGQTFAPLQTILAVGRSASLTINPINDADTRLDIVIADRTNGKAKIFYQLANDQFDDNPNAIVSVDLRGRAIGIASGLLSKFDAIPYQLDNRIDIVACVIPDGLPGEPYYDARIDMLANTGGATNSQFRRLYFGQSPDPNDFPYTRDVLVIDYNVDGFPDVLASNAGEFGDDAFEGFSILLNRR